MHWVEEVYRVLQTGGKAYFFHNDAREYSKEYRKEVDKISTMFKNVGFRVELYKWNSKSTNEEQKPTIIATK